MEIKASLSMLNVARKEMFPNQKIHPKITTNQLIHTSKSHSLFLYCYGLPQIKTVYYINKLDLKEIKPFLIGN